MGEESLFLVETSSFLPYNEVGKRNDGFRGGDFIFPFAPLLSYSKMFGKLGILFSGRSTPNFELMKEPQRETHVMSQKASWVILPASLEETNLTL